MRSTIDHSKRVECHLHIETNANKTIFWYFPNSDSIFGFRVDDSAEFLSKLANMLKNSGAARGPVTLTAYDTWDGVAKEQGVVEYDPVEDAFYIWDAFTVHAFRADQLLQMMVHPPQTWSIPKDKRKSGDLQWNCLKRLVPLADYAR